MNSGADDANLYRCTTASVPERTAKLQDLKTLRFWSTAAAGGRNAHNLTDGSSALSQPSRDGQQRRPAPEPSSAMAGAVGAADADGARAAGQEFTTPLTPALCFDRVALQGPFACSSALPASAAAD